MRLPPLDAGALSPARKAVYDAIQQGPRSSGGRQVGMAGPFGVWVRAPRVGGAIQALGTAVRYESTLAANVREVAICTVGMFYRARFEFAAHRRLAVEAGVDDAKLECLRTGRDPGFAADEDVAWRVAVELLNEHRISDALYAEAHAAFGEEGLIELVTTVGYYCLVSHTLNAFEVPLGEGMTDPFPGEQ